MSWTYRTIRDGATFSAEGVFQQDGVMRHYRSANGFKTEAAARQRVYEQQAREAEEGIDSDSK